MSELHTHQNHEDHPNHPKPSERDTRYWLSFDQLAETPEFKEMAEKEFLTSPLRDDSEPESGWARREFLKLMGASMAMATAGCIRRPVQKIVPYNKQPEEVTFTVANHYTSSFSDGSEVMGLLVKSRDGRPIKVEGNPNHPLNKGATSIRAQAHVLSLYDPERLSGPRKNLLNKEKTNRDTVSAKWEDIDNAVVKQLAKGGIAVFTGNLNSPSTRAVVGDFCQAFGAKHFVWDMNSNEDVRDGQRLSYGDAVVPFYRFDKAKVIVSIDADFLGSWLAPVAFTKQFSAARKDIKTMNRLVVFDSSYSLTGANADLRFRIKPSQQLDVVMALLHEIIVKKAQSKFAGDSRIKNTLEGFASAAAGLPGGAENVAKIASWLLENKGKSLVVAGGLATQTAWSKDLQVAVNLLNSVLDNDGNTVDYKNSFAGNQATAADLTELIEKLKAGQIKTLIIHRNNPLYSLPASSGFADAMKKAEMVLYTGDRNDETGLFCDYLIPDNHPMEAWNDSEAVAGMFAIQQPTIRPLYDTRSFQLSLMTWAYLAEKGPKRLTVNETYYDYLREYWKTEIFPKHGKGQSFDAFWDAALQAGVVDGSAKSSGGARSIRTESFVGIKRPKGESMELVMTKSLVMGEGNMANVSWLQELPDPVTKIVWDNYASISMASAQKLGVKQGQILEVKLGDKKMRLPANIQPGLHDEVLVVKTGYGRTQAGKVGNNIGVNVSDFMVLGKAGFVSSGSALEVRNTKENYILANPQGHHSMEGRKIVVEATLKEYVKDPAANNHHHKIWNLWSGHQYNGHKWGMAIDLNSCTGCNACVVACQSENNIPVVGKKYVIQGREMHWIRIDRYYVGSPAEAETVFQPVMCQHCDNAPCETVCPVLATVHSSEGLNDMVYNRCVGTRYCSNNCPYKVRRFNWFNFTKNIEKPLHLALNPDVTVRPRGVMEKCSFCVQRIKDGKSKAKLESRILKDGDIKTACQQVCPADAIAFGDMNDPESKVAKMMKEDQRGYALLEEFHAAPSVRYFTKIRNNDQEARGGHSAHGGEHA